MSSSTFRPRKSLGQNFLVDENIARKIIADVAPNPQDTIVEIGPGFGVLTKYLIPAAERVIAVEIDKRLVAELQTEFRDEPNLELVAHDFLKLELAEYVRKDNHNRVVGNIPYHITSPVIFKIFDMREHFHDMTLMIQKEVADRIVARPGSKDYGILSIFSQLYSVPKILFRVSRNVFRPKPDVDSAMVRWDFSQAPRFEIQDAQLLDRVIHTVFQQRRKMLRKSMQQIAQFKNKSETLDFELRKRPEELTPLEFIKLTNALVD